MKTLRRIAYRFLLRTARQNRVRLVQDLVDAGYTAAQAKTLHPPSRLTYEGREAKTDRKVFPSRVKFQEGKPKVFWYRQQQVHRRNKRAPVGAYVVAVPKNKADAQVKIRKPLVVEWGATRGAGSWVEVVSQRFGGRVGPALSSHLRSKRIDAVVTLRGGKPYQIVLLNVPLTEGKVDAASIREADATAKYNKYFKPAFVDTGESPAPTPESRLRDEVGRQEMLLRSAKSSVSTYKRKLKGLRSKIALFEEKAQVPGISAKVEKSLGAKIQSYREKSREVEGAVGLAETRLTQQKVSLVELQANPSKFLRSVIEPLEKLFGKGASEADFYRLSGVDGLGGAYRKPILGTLRVSRGERVTKITLTLDNGQGPVSSLAREISLHPDGKVEIYNDVFKLAPGSPKGLGARMFYSQVLQAQKIGASKITCNAFRGAQQNGRWAGYYTWARYGYTAPIRDLAHTDTSLGKQGSVYDDFVSLVKGGLFPPHIMEGTDPGTVTMRDLMMTKKGRGWWRAYGTEWDAEFDLTPDENGGPSKCVQVLEAYIREQESVRGSMAKWAAVARGHSRLGGRHEEIDLDPEDEVVFDRVWERMRVRAVKELV